jgi:hypothetical protein
MCEGFYPKELQVHISVYPILIGTPDGGSHIRCQVT